MMLKFKHILAFAVVVAVCFTFAHHAQAQPFIASQGEENVNFLLDILKKVLDVITGFIGDVLDEFVRAIKDLMGGDGK